MNRLIPKNISPQELDRWIKDKLSSPFFIDVREIHEINFAPFSFEVLHLPLSQMNVWSDTILIKLPKDRPLIIICHAGIRSMSFAIWLLEQSFEYEIWNLKGGIDAWSKDVDTSIPRY